MPSFARQAGVPMSKQQAQKPFDPSTFMAAFDGGVTASTYGEGQLIFSQGAPADAVFYIQNGKVKLSVVSDQGKEAVVAFLEAGDFCGEGCLAGQLVRMATAMRPRFGRCEKKKDLNLGRCPPEDRREDS